MSKDNLILEARGWGVSEEGTVNKLRQRLVKYTRENPEAVKGKPEDPDDYDEETDKLPDRQLLDDNLTLEG